MLAAEHSHSDIERALVAFFYAAPNSDLIQKLEDVRRTLLSHFFYSEEELFPFLRKEGFSPAKLDQLRTEQSGLLAHLKQVQNALPSVKEHAADGSAFSRASRDLQLAWTQHDANENRALVEFWDRRTLGWDDS